MALCYDRVCAPTLDTTGPSRLYARCGGNQAFSQVSSVRDDSLCGTTIFHKSKCECHVGVRDMVPRVACVIVWLFVFGVWLAPSSAAARAPLARLGLRQRYLRGHDQISTPTGYLGYLARHCWRPQHMGWGPTADSGPADRSGLLLPPGPIERRRWAGSYCDKAMGVLETRGPPLAGTARYRRLPPQAGSQIAPLAGK